MAQSDFTNFDPGLIVGSATRSCGGKEKKAAPPEYWIEIELEGDDGSACAGEEYSIKCPDGSVATGFLNQLGFARVALTKPGSCEVSFPGLDKEAWESAQ